MTNPNQNIDYASNVLSTGPVDWVNPLAQYYKDDEEKRRKQGVLLEKQDKQRADAIKSNSVVDLVTSVAKFSTAARKMKAAIDKKNAQREADDNKEMEGYINLLGPDYGDDYIEASKLIYKKTVKGITIDEERLTKLQEKLRLQEDDDPIASQARHAIMNAKGSTLIFAKSMFARQQLSEVNADTMLTDFTNDPEGRFKELNDAYDPKTNHEDTLRKYQRIKLAHLDLNASTFAAVLGPEVKRQQQTARGISRANAVTEISSIEDQNLNTQIKTASKSGTFSDAIHSIADHLQNNGGFVQEKDAAGNNIGPTPRQQVQARLYKSLKRLAYDGDITSSDLESYLTSQFKSPAGSGPDKLAETSKTLFTKEQVNDLIDSAKIGDTRYLAVQKVRVDKSLPDLELRKRRGEDVSVEIARIRRLYPDEAMGKKLDNIENIVVDNDSEEGSYDFERAKLNTRRQNGTMGTMTDAEIDEIPNKKLRDEIRAEVDLIKKARTEQQYEERWLDLEVASGLGRTLKLQEPLMSAGVKVRNDLRTYFRREFERLVRLDPDNPNNYNTAITATKKYFKAHGGGGEHSDQGGVGKFAAHSDGRYDNYEKYDQNKTNRYDHSSIGSSKGEEKKYTKRVLDAIREVTVEGDAKISRNTVIEKVLAVPHSILDAEDIMGAYESGKISQEIMLKAKQLGINAFQLLQAQYNASKHLPAYQNFDESALQTLDEESERLTAYEQLLRNTGQNDLVYILKRVQLQNASPNQLLRFEKALTEAEAGRAEGFQSTIEGTDELIGEKVEAQNQIVEERLLEINKKKAKAKLEAINKEALETEAENNTGEYFRDVEDDRTDAELDAQFTSQPGVF